MYHVIYWKKDQEPAFEIFKSKKARKDYYDEHFKDSENFEDENPQFVGISPDNLNPTFEGCEFRFHGKFYELNQSVPIVDFNTTAENRRYFRKEYNRIFRTKKDRQKYYSENVIGRVTKDNPRYYEIKGETINKEYHMELKNYSFH